MFVVAHVPRVPARPNTPFLLTTLAGPSHAAQGHAAGQASDRILPLRTCHGDLAFGDTDLALARASRTRVPCCALY